MAGRSDREGRWWFWTLLTWNPNDPPYIDLDVGWGKRRRRAHPQIASSYFVYQGDQYTSIISKKMISATAIIAVEYATIMANVHAANGREPSLRIRAKYFR